MTALERMERCGGKPVRGQAGTLARILAVLRAKGVVIEERGVFRVPRG